MFGGGFPFGGGFEGMGGMGAPREPANTTEYYETLGVEKDATTKQIKKAFMKIAAKEHPDKGGDAEKFKAASEAYEVLSDEKKRKLYDAHGKEGVEKMGDPSGPDLGSMFGFGGGGRSRVRKTRDQQYPMNVTLEKLAKGHTAKFNVTRDVLCSGCSGKGVKDGASEVECTGCDGHGVVLMVRRMGPMIQQIQRPCPECNGAGKQVAESDKCTTCRGNKVVKKREMMEVAIEKGMRHGQRITLRGKSDEAPDAETGDLVFVIQQKKHDVFVRREADLVMKKKIKLIEALTGTKFTVSHPDGRSLLVKSAPGEVISAGQTLCVENGGMPQYGSPFSFGNLFINFEIQMPAAADLDADARATLSSVLPPATDAADIDPEDHDYEHYEMREVDPEAEQARRKAQRAAHAEAYDSDSDGGGPGGQRVQCAHQ